jgi:hypothetical protein
MTYEYRKRWREENLEGSFEKKLRVLLHKAKNRAKRLGREFAITAEDFSPASHCPLLGAAFEFRKKGKGPSPFSPTIDRIDSSLGYVPGNVWVISHRANAIKRGSTVEELEMIVANLRTRLGL